VSTAAIRYEAIRRAYLRRLDDCLELLEAAHEEGLIGVSSALAEVVSPRVPTVVPGMRIAEAIEEVLRYQEPYMKPLPLAERRQMRRRHWDALSHSPWR
jgi:hypothetical protein